MITEQRTEVGFLHPFAERALLRNLLNALGFEVREEAELSGLSGLSHRNVILGFRENDKHAVVVQRGIERAYQVGARPPQDPDTLARVLSFHSRTGVGEREDLYRREALFSGIDLQARLENEGYLCDLLFFLNSAPLSTWGLNWRNPEQHSSLGAPEGLLWAVHSSIDPILRLHRDELANNALATGACFVALDDFSLPELNRLTAATTQALATESSTILTRLRVTQYFHPPIDEFLLGLAATRPSVFDERQLIEAAAISAGLCHPPKDSVRLTSLATANPLDVARALAAEGKLSYKGRVAIVTPDGAEIVHEIETRPQESWTNKIGKLLSIAGLARKFLGP